MGLQSKVLQNISSRRAQYAELSWYQSKPCESGPGILRGPCDHHCFRTERKNLEKALSKTTIISTGMGRI